MVKIHWSIYIILGAAVLYVSNKLDPQRFRLFIWLGYLFLTIGIAKLGIWFIKRKKESPKENKELRNYTYPQPKAAQSCQRCRNPLQGYENFCPYCGQRLK